ncbi:uncharacterized protein LOC124653890 [Lolium rigidum]|uniref:uncharacterized protein LOC124653890 n=1 Tax=Lolium rigidum TaxID=89674 RepID=UPI001F5C4421|nr:uncharacterized protein LOC124653890 [Lolium rigidum]XP_047048905.1 uncharacterized protein LOC124653890 [Lolium rigidum]
MEFKRLRWLRWAKAGRYPFSTTSTSRSLFNLQYMEFLKGTYPGVSYHGAPDYRCQFCGAVFWYPERCKIESSVRQRRVLYSLCCRGGKVWVPPFASPPPFLADLLRFDGDSRRKPFIEKIRQYNSLFAFTSMGADIDKHVNDSGGPPVFKISGQVHHRIGSLLPAKGASPKFVELYIHETQNEVTIGIKAVMPEADPTEVDIDVDIVGGLQSMLDVCSPLVKKFRDARDRLKDEGDTRIAIRIVGAEKGDHVQFNLPAVSELAALIVGDFSAENYRRDIIVDSKLKGLHHVPSLHLAFMSLQYPLLFPHGDRGFQLGIPHRDIQPGCTEGRTTVSMQEYYCFCCHYRQNQYNPFLCCGKLSAQSQVDSFACVEEGRLTYIAGHQDDFRCEHFQGVADAVGKGNLDGSSIGKKRIVPASFIGGDRYQQPNFQDAVAICRVYGSPHLFPTFTCCPKWPEIKEALLLEPGQRYTDRSDLVVRVFKMTFARYTEIKPVKAYKLSAAPKLLLCVCVQGILPERKCEEML